MNTPERRLLPNAADKASLRAIATSLVQACPSLLEAAREVALQLLIDKGLPGLDPDRIYFHRFRAAQSSNLTFTGWEHLLEKPYESLTLTQLVIQRFRATDQDNADLLGLYCGFYADGPQADNFNQDNEIRLLGSDVLQAFWNIDFSSRYTRQLTTYWQTSSQHFRTLAKCNFLSLAVQALQQGHLEGTDFQRVIDSVIGSVTWPVTLQMLQASHPVGAHVRALDLDGHVATYALRFVEDNGRQTLYLPGEVQPFRLMEDQADLHWWMLEQMNTEDKRKIFMNRFSLADRNRMGEKLNDLMTRLVSTWGHSDHRMINHGNVTISGDAFTWLSDSTRSAMFAEADMALTSNSDLRKKLWMGYLSAGLRVFGPMATVGWPLALPVIGAGIANMGLNIDLAVNGRTAVERKAGTLGAVLNGIEALFNVPFLIGTGAHLEVGPQVEFAEAEEMAGLIEFTSGNDPFLPPLDQAPLLTTDEETDEMANDIPIETSPRPTLHGLLAPQIPARYQCNELLDRFSVETESGKFQGIYRLGNAQPYAIEIEGNAYYVRYFDASGDSGNWAIVDPEHPNQFAYSLPVRFSATGKWERTPALRLKGGGQCVGTPCASDIELTSQVISSTPSPGLPLVEPVPSTARPLRLVTTLGEIGELDVAKLKKWAMNLPQDSADMANIVPDHPSDEEQFTLFFSQKRTRLLNEAKEHYSELDWTNLPARPVIPEVSHSMPTDELVDRVFEKTMGLVVGETLDRVTSMRFMISNMPAFARHITTLYVGDLLSDFAQMDLNGFYTSGQMSEDLRIYLGSLGTDPGETFNILELVKTAQANGVRVQGLGCAAISKMKVPLTSIEEQMMNAQQINRIMWGDALLNRPGKWVALIDAQNTNNFRNLPGISELRGGIGLRIEESLPSEVPGVSIDPGVKVARGPFDNGASTRNSFDYLYADLRLQIDAPPVIWTEAAQARLLHRNGMYLVEKSQNGYTLVRRGSTGSIVRTPVNLTQDGQAYIWLQSMPRISGVLFPDIAALSQRLIEIGLKLQSRLPT
ncbi:membrane-targeted effector domain-containing toxin [Pseudomonas sp. SDT291_1_S447]